MRKLISTFLFSVAYATPGEFKDGTGTDYCLICEYINVADSEADAITALNKDDASDPCILADVSF